MLWAVVIAGLGMSAAVVSHVLASRSGGGRLGAYACSLLMGAIGVALLCAFALSRGAIDGWSAAIGLLLFCAWWFIFLNFVQAMESSIRIRIAREMRAGGGSMPRALLAERYNDERLVRLRLERLLAGGAITARDGHLFVTSRSLLLLARFFRLLKLILIGKRSEFSRDAASLRSPHP